MNQEIKYFIFNLIQKINYDILDSDEFQKEFGSLITNENLFKLKKICLIYIHIRQYDIPYEQWIELIKKNKITPIRNKKRVVPTDLDEFFQNVVYKIN